MEKLGDKIRRLIKEKGYPSLKAFYSDLVATFEDSHIDRTTLTRLLKNQVTVRERTLVQIAIMLGVKTSFLRQGTEAEISAVKQPEGVFTYNARAATRILDRDLPFVTEKLSLKNGGRTAEMQDPPGVKESLKWIFVLVGKINVVIQEQDGWNKQTLHKSQRLAFDAKKTHYFENLSGNTSLCLIIHYPASNNTLYAEGNSAKQPGP